ncbi:MFS transporter [Rhodopseudomonas palustris]|uniref:MFS transporter n=1 Tax=Rhodopseudomonas palustris TaxID=1076 RepID=A0A323UJS6_RHOPL|nr:MFS transporter [Rhodopseudomonas palustris]PZA11860.1 MFS transporter [Rhodopseudomonas palustris]
MDHRASRIGLFILGLCFVLSLLGRGLGESFTVFLLPISASFGWDRAEVVSIYSLTALCTGLASPLVGRLFDRSGPRAVYTLGMALLGGALLIAAYAERLWQLQITVGLCVGLGIACTGNVPNSILLGRWFGAKLPTAMAVVYSAIGAGVLVMLPVAQVLIERFGWREAYLILGVAMLILLVPLSLLPWRRFAAGADAHTRRPSNEAVDDDWTLASAMRHHAFWALFATFFFTAIGMYSISVQVVAYLVDAGFTPLQAATAWGFSGVVLVVGMLGVSWLDGVIGRRPSILVSYAISITGLALLWLLQWYQNLLLLGGFVICFGSMIGSRGPLITATAMSIFRGRRVGTIYGTISIGSGLGSAFGSWCGGLLHDLTQSYNPVLGFALISVVLGMIPFLVVPALRERQ